MVSLLGFEENLSLSLLVVLVYFFQRAEASGSIRFKSSDSQGRGSTRTCRIWQTVPHSGPVPLHNFEAGKITDPDKGSITRLLMILGSSHVKLRSHFGGVQTKKKRPRGESLGSERRSSAWASDRSEIWRARPVRKKTGSVEPLWVERESKRKPTRFGGVP